MDLDRDPSAAARDLVADLFPQAVWAVLAGSVLTTRRTSGSDLDIVVLLPAGDPAAPRRDSRHFRGWPVEVFVHDDETLDHWIAKDAAERRPTLCRMVATGVPVVGDPGDRRDRCARLLAAGPQPLTAEELDRARYALTDLLDDLVHAADPGERQVTATAAWTAAAQLALAGAGHWTGTGKWLLRELRDLDPVAAGRWLAAAGDPAAIETFGKETLDRYGGPLFDGYLVTAPRPQRAG